MSHTTNNVIYEEKEGIAIIAINRPEKKNTLTESVIAGIADGIDEATRSKQVSAIVCAELGIPLQPGMTLHRGVNRLITLTGHRISKPGKGPGIRSGIFVSWAIMSGAL